MPSSRTRVSLLAAAVVAATSTAALAHAHLRATLPAREAVVTNKPEMLALTFTEGLNLAFSGVALSEGDHAVPVGKTRLKTGDDRTLVVDLPKPLPAGRYTVKWHALSRDGHRTEGQYRFTVAPR